MKKRLAGWVLRLLGWRPKGEVPPEPKMVVIAVPHTSNRDFIPGILAAWALGLKVSWIGKHTLFRWPYGWFMRWIGGIPVERHVRARVVEQMVGAFDEAESLYLMVAPEGTRRPLPYWKSGFYHIAVGAGVPIALGFINGAEKRLGLGPLLVPTGDIGSDMDQIRAFYADIPGIRPENTSKMRLREED